LKITKIDYILSLIISLSDLRINSRGNRDYRRSMKEIEQIFCLIKFGQKEHVEKLLKEGELYFNTVSTYAELDDEERGDANEGAEWINNAQVVKIKVEHPTLGSLELFPTTNQLSKLRQYNFYYLSFSLYAISPRSFEKTDSFQIDNRMLSFSDTAILIKEPYKFINSIVSKLKKKGIKYEANIVTYDDLCREGNIELSPFIKKMEHQHQMEFRIIIENKDNQPKLISIGSIEDYSVIVSSESMIATIWQAKKQVE